MPPRPLPIDPLLPEIIAALSQATRLVLRAEPGAGKTTRVPPAILEAGLSGGDVVWVVQPRRLAARLAARWVATEIGEEVGGRIGYRVRHENVTSSATRLCYLTDGVLTRHLAIDPDLDGVGVVVLDEFHERRVNTDLGLALLRRLQRRRSDLQLVVMSATLAGEAVAEYMAPCPLFEVPGRAFEVAISHAPKIDRRPLAERVRAAVREALSDESTPGDLLVFLPGWREIANTAAVCAEVAARHDLLLLPLHGSLSPADQDRAVRPASQRKLILATNVAETSVTIEGVTEVIDSGLARVAGFDRISGLPTLRTGSISKAAATQRAGRAGRTQAGRCVRLYTKVEYDQRPPYDTPELLRADLAETLLLMANLDVEPTSLDWLDSPPAPALVAAGRLLRTLRAIDGAGVVTDLGKRMLRSPAHPRLARLLFAGEALGVGDDAAVVAALLGERDLRIADRRAAASGLSDLTLLRDSYRAAEGARFAADPLRRLGINPAVARRTARARDQLRGHLQKGGPPAGDPDAALRRAVFTAFADRVAVARLGKGERRGKREVRLMSGQRLAVAETSVVRDAEWVVVVEAEEQRRAASRRVTASLVSAIDPDWILDDCGEEDGLVAAEELVWNDDAGRVEEVASLRYGILTLDERRRPAPASDRAAEMLLARARLAGLSKLVGKEEAGAIERLHSRMAFLRAAMPELGLPEVGEDALAQCLGELCAERTALAELSGGVLLRASSDRLGSACRQLEIHAPVGVKLPGGRKLEVNYERDRPPWVQSFLQDFFGSHDGPRVAGGRVPLTLHLLAPNRRAVQVTTDLAGFWQRHYPALRRSLSRRYPRHDWPEDPTTGRPPSPGGRRGKKRSP